MTRLMRCLSAVEHHALIGYGEKLATSTMTIPTGQT
jgi:hypothetical protein